MDYGKKFGGCTSAFFSLSRDWVKNILFSLGMI